MIDDDERSGGGSHGTAWHDDVNVAVAGGVAALLLLALLVYGVIRVSQDSSTRPPDVGVPGTTTSTSPTHTSGLRTPPSSSYSLPSAAPTSEPSEPAPATTDPGAGPATTPDAPTPTTIYNPYTTSTTTNAGHV